MRTTALGKTALTLSALLATGTAATAGIYVVLAGAAVGQADDSASAVDGQEQLAGAAPSDPTSASTPSARTPASTPSARTSASTPSKRAKDAGARTSTRTSSKPRPSFTATPTPKKTSAPPQTKTKGS